MAQQTIEKLQAKLRACEAERKRTVAAHVIATLKPRARKKVKS